VSCSLKEDLDQWIGVINRSVSNGGDTEQSYSRNEEPKYREDRSTKSRKLGYDARNRVRARTVSDLGVE
jgi:hypothetical protein